MKKIYSASNLIHLNKHKQRVFYVLFCCDSPAGTEPWSIYFHQTGKIKLFIEWSHLHPSYISKSYCKVYWCILNHLGKKIPEGWFYSSPNPSFKRKKKKMHLPFFLGDQDEMIWHLAPGRTATVLLPHAWWSTQSLRTWSLARPCHQCPSLGQYLPFPVAGTYTD